MEWLLWFWNLRLDIARERPLRAGLDYRLLISNIAFGLIRRPVCPPREAKLRFHSANRTPCLWQDLISSGHLVGSDLDINHE